MKVAIVHDWLTGMRGGERVLEQICELFPDASLYTLFYKPGSVSRRIASMPIHTSFLNRIPGVLKHYPHWLPLFPFAISKFDLSGFDLILSVSHAAAKGIRKPKESLHICYCLTPMRYIWDMQNDYFEQNDRLHAKQAALQAISLPLRIWDRATAKRVDHFIADSQFVQNRIRKYYGRESTVIYPPVDTEFFTPSSNGTRTGYYLLVSALVSYKRVDAVIDAFNQLGSPLVIAGTGPDLGRLKARAAANIEFKGFVADENLRNLYRQCRAVVVAACEDFGLVSLEAQACGRPAIAYAAGGSLESVLDGDTGVLFSPRTVAGLIKAIRRFESTDFNRDKLRKNAERFSRETFRQALSTYVKSKLPSNGNAAELHQAVNTAVSSLSHSAGAAKPHPSVTSVAKRSFDIVFSIGALLVLGLPLLLIACIIRLQSKGPAFFHQTRIGYRGKQFTIAKLRTMLVDAEREGHPVWALDDDPRCTPMGGILRKFGIDELPQLWNVLKGDMSLVGPRPERPEFHAMFEREFPDFARRLEARGGITGLAQIRGWRGNTAIQGRLQCDLEYVERWSFSKDIQILCRTPFSLIRSPKRAPMVPSIRVVEKRRAGSLSSSNL